eukprot:COSAG01_NODE_17957_length_1111_cov_4.724308_1_plen_68_part_10
MLGAERFDACRFALSSVAQLQNTDTGATVTADADTSAPIVPLHPPPMFISQTEAARRRALETQVTCQV